MKIAAIPTPIIQSNNNEDLHKLASKSHKSHKKSVIGKKKPVESSTNTSCCSECTESDSETSSVAMRPVGTKLPIKTVPSKAKLKQTSIGTTTSSGSDTDSSDDGDDSSDSNSTAKSNKNNPLVVTKKLAHNRPKLLVQKQAVQDLRNNKSGSEQIADGASSSDMELPALVNAAIQRVESCSDGESSKTELTTQYTSSLLRDFMVKTQMLGASVPSADAHTAPTATTSTETKSAGNGKQDTIQNRNEIKTELVPIQMTAKRKRGRPKKQTVVLSSLSIVPTSESPDSGITSTPHSPVPLNDRNRPNTSNENHTLKKKIGKKVKSSSSMDVPVTHKLNIASLEKCMYATERVLYPPRRKKRDTSVTSNKSSATTAEDLLDPVWRKIDINKKFRRPSVSGYKSDGGTVCSKVLAAQSNFMHNYGSLNQRILSGYKSDYSCKSKRSGYKSDCSMKAKSCGYRSDCSGKHRKKVRRKRRLKMFNTKSPVNDLDILQLAGLSLGQSEESSRDSLHKSNSSLMKKSLFRQKSTTGHATDKESTATGKDILNSLCERVTKRLSGLDNQISKSRSTVSTPLPELYKTKSSYPKSGLITCRRASAVSHCSSRSTISRMHFRKRRRKRFKSRSRSECYQPELNITKLNLQIDMLTNSFSTLCHINSVTTGSTNKDSTNKTSSKRIVKKRKQSENIDVSTTGAPSAPSKRRNKKMIQTQSPDDHKLPLKKRHYLLTPDGKHLTTTETTSDKHSKSLPAVTYEAAASGSSHDRFRSNNDDVNKVSSAHKNTGLNLHSKMSSKAITPKKRHLLETPNNSSVYTSLNNIFPTTTNTTTTSRISQHSPISSSDVNSRDSLIVPLPDNLQLKYQQQYKKNDVVARKKNRLEGLVSRIMQPINSSSSSSSSNETNTTFRSTYRPSVIRNVHSGGPPPGVFEPTIDLEVQIPPIAPVIIAKTEIDSPRMQSETIAKLVKDEPSQKIDRVLEALLNKTGGHLLLKKKRKKQNRTGFPTVRKKKKKISENELTALEMKPLDLDDDNLSMQSTDMNSSDTIPVAKTLLDTDIVQTMPIIINAISADCDRVPKLGEAADTFIERNSRPRLSVVSLERLQGKEPISICSEPKNDVATPHTSNTLEPNKRTRENSDEINVLNKKYKNDVIVRVKQNLKKNTRTPRDLSSDNEPLINFIPHNEKVHLSKSSSTVPCKSSKLIQKWNNLNSVSNIDASLPKRKATNSKRKNSIAGNSETLLVSIPNLTSTITASVKSINSSGNNGEEPLHLKKGRKSDVQLKENQISCIDRNFRYPIVKIKMLDQKYLPNKKHTNPVRVLKRKADVGKASDIDVNTKVLPEETVKLNKVQKTIEPIADTQLLENENQQHKSSSVIETDISNDFIKKQTSKQDKVNQKKSQENDGKIIAPQKKSQEDDVKIIAPQKKTISTLNKSVPSETVIDNSIVKNCSISIVTNVDVVPTVPKRMRKPNPKHADTVIDWKTKDVVLSIDKESKQKKGRKPQPDKILPALDTLITIPPTTTKATHEHETDSCTDLNEIMPCDDLNDCLEHDPLPSDEETCVIEFPVDCTSSIDAATKKLTKLKKKYLCAGLFSDYYKESPKSNAEKSSVTRLNYTSDDYPQTLLPQPSYCEKYFRRTRQDFTLPYDLWWAHENSKLPGRNIVPSWNYKKIRTNVYGDVRPNPSTDQQQICSCKSATACGDDCLNRLMYTECSPKTCPCADKCENTKIQRHIVAPGVERFMTENKGWGVKAKLPIKKGVYILEYVGEVVTEREFKERMATLYTRDTHHYCLNLDGGLVIDGHRTGSDGRFVNHSCSPNCEMQKWCVNGLFRMALFAMRDIVPGEELTYDYNFSLFNPTEGQPCRCDTPQCRGVIGGKSQRIKPIQELPVKI